MTLEADVTTDKRKIGRVEFKAPSVVVLCDTGETIYVQVEDASPRGMGLWMNLISRARISSSWLIP